MIVRDAQKGDELVIEQLYQEFYVESGGISDSSPPKIGEGKLIVCDIKGELVGYGMGFAISYCNKDFTQAYHIYVKPNYRKTKVAGLIYRSFMKWAKTEGKPILLLSDPNKLKSWEHKGYKSIRHIMVKEAI